MNKKITFLVSALMLILFITFISPVSGENISDTDTELIYSDSNNNGSHDPGEVIWEVVQTSVTASVNTDTGCIFRHDHDHRGHSPANGQVDAVLITAEFGVFHTSHSQISQITTKSQSQFENEDSYESQLGYSAFKLADLNIGSSATVNTEAEVTTSCRGPVSNPNNVFESKRSSKENRNSIEKTESVTRNIDNEDISMLLDKNITYKVSTDAGGEVNNISTINIKIEEINNQTENATLKNKISFDNGTTSEFNTTTDLETGMGNNSKGFLIPTNVSIGDKVLNNSEIVDIKNETILNKERKVIKVEKRFQNSFGNNTAGYNSTYDNETGIMLNTEIFAKGLNNTVNIDWNIKKASWITNENTISEKYDENNDGLINRDELRNAIIDFVNRDVSRNNLRKIIVQYVQDST